MHAHLSRAHAHLRSHLSRLHAHLSSGILEEQCAKNALRPTKAERAVLKAKVEGDWRLRLGHALESHQAHGTVLMLVFFDVLLVACEVILRDVCPTPQGGFAQGSWEYYRVRRWGEGLSWTSRSILLLLLLHQGGLMVAYGCSYFKKFAYVVDLLIVAVALGLEMAHLAEEVQHGGSHRMRALAAPAAADDHHDDTPDEASNLIIVLLAWRVVRVLHGFAITSLEHADNAEVLELQDKVSELEAELRRLRGGGSEGGSEGGSKGGSKGGSEGGKGPEGVTTLVAAALVRSSEEAAAALPVEAAQR